MINSVFLSYYPGTPTTIPGTAKGVVIDARGVSNLTCSAVNPWINLLWLRLIMSAPLSAILFYSPLERLRFSRLGYCPLIPI
jgi:hypothetical protein